MHKSKIIHRNFYTQDAATLAQNLLGKWICISSSDEEKKYMQITETEAYLGKDDLASHSRFGKNKRTNALYKEGGHLYIYLIYGIYYMLNIVSSFENDPQAVLIRKGNLFHYKKNTIKILNKKINGPGILSKVLGIDLSFNGEDLLSSSRISLIPYLDRKNKMNFFYIYVSKRININYSGEWKYKLLRFYI